MLAGLCFERANRIARTTRAVEQAALISAQHAFIMS